MVYKNPVAGTAQWCGKVLEPVFRVPDLLLLPSAPCVTLKSLNTSVTLFSISNIRERDWGLHCLISIRGRWAHNP